MPSTPPTPPTPPSIVDDAPLRALNTFGIDARARRLVTLTDVRTLPAALEACGPDGPALVLGGGSNLLLTRDVDAAVLRIASRGRAVVEQAGDDVIVEAAAGEPWHPFVQWTLAHGLFGLENLSLIPGLVGASPIQNIGAYGVEMADRMQSLQAIHLRTGLTRRFDARDCRFGYRDSVFKHDDGVQWLIASVRFALSRRADPRPGYGDIGAELQARGIAAAAATPQQIAEAVCAIRRRKLPDPARIGNAGSFFKNPVLPRAQADALRRAHPAMPIYPAGDERCKIAAAWLIEHCGWKGFREGDAGVHPQHALVLVNYGRARGDELLALARRIQDSVRQRFGVAIEPEPRVI
ncbi:MAG: UDP-N-acetylmuramate dehydrogenase [Burkholderiaceae bacterium]